MANTLGILEATLEQISDASHAINVLGGAAGNARRNVYDIAVVRVTNHADDDNTETGDVADSMALFVSKAHGHAWIKQTNCQNRINHSGAPIVTGTDGFEMNYILPDFDYSTFE